MSRAAFLRWTSALALLAASLTGCAAGPTYRRPDTPSPATFTGHALTATVGSPSAPSQRWAVGATIPARWWQAFGSSTLDRRVADALAHNPDLEAAQAALREARENLAAQRASLFPTAQVSYAPSRQRDATGTLSPTLASNATYYTLHTAQLSVSYNPDVFGGGRRSVEAAQALADAQGRQLDAVRLDLAGSVVQAAIQEASLQAQAEATQDIIQAQTRALDILRQQARLGYASGLDVAAQETALAQARAALPAIEKQRAQNRDLLAALGGDTADRAGAPEFDLKGLGLPATLPDAVPSTLVDRRPDVRAAEDQVHAASAQVGVALAARLPQFTLSGAYGSSATTFSRLFTDDNLFWSLAGSVTQTVFDFGALKHRQGAAEAALAQSAAQYRSVVLAAFQNVADVLHAIDDDARTLAAADDAEAAARHTLDLTREQQALGYVNALTLINAEQAYQAARITRIQAQAARLSDTASLYVALGGDAPPASSTPP